MGRGPNKAWWMLVIGVGACCLAGFSLASDPRGSVSKAQLDQTLYNVAQRQQAIDVEVAPVKSPAELSAYLAEHPSTPLDTLSPQAKGRFLASLVFGARGLGSYEYDDLREELTPTQIYKILSLFGVQGTITSIPGLYPHNNVDTQILSGTVPKACALPNVKNHQANTEVAPLAGCGSEGYSCVGRGNCMQNNQFLCTSNC